MSRPPTSKDTRGKGVDLRSFEAVIFDLDGVLTQTSEIHAMAWTALFNEFLKARQQDGDEDCRPFSNEDYFRHVDGKPRREGIKAFLRSRNIELSEGAPTDPPGMPSVDSLAANKNELFLKLLRDRGVETEPGATELIEQLKVSDVGMAVVSSSRNCTSVLKAAGLDDVFDVVVDGCIAEELALAGKPSPDAYLEAARRLAVTPRDAVVLEDALAGVAAARAGGFGLIVGVDHGAGAERMRAHGANVVVTSLSELTHSSTRKMQSLPHPPSALDDFVRLARRLMSKRATVFLDYDGTLTPIVSRPELAVLDPEMREVVAKLSRLCPVAVISGRALGDVKRLVGLDSLIYAGSHGFDIEGPEGSGLYRQIGKEFAPAISRAANTLRTNLSSIPGVVVEDKKFSVAVHYRLVAEADLPRVKEAVDAVQASEPNLRQSGGKKVFELRPAMDWDKGRAIDWLLHVLGQDGSDWLPIYLGDDATDEDAFRALEGRGIGIIVSDGSRTTRAVYQLQDTDDVRIFLQRLTHELDQHEHDHG